MDANFLNRILTIVIIALAVLLGLSMGGVLPYVSHVSVSPVFFTITSTSYITYTSTMYSTVTHTSTVITTATIVHNYTQTLTMTSTVTQVSSTTVTVTSTITRTITPTTTSQTVLTGPILLLNTTSNANQYTGFIMNDTLYVYYTVPLSQLIGIKINGLNITNAPVPVSSGVGAPGYYNNGLLLIENIGGDLAIVYWNFKTLKVLTPVEGYYMAYAYNPETTLIGTLWEPKLLAFNETRLIIFNNWKTPAIANVSIPYADTIRECPNGSFIIQLLNSTYVVYPGFKDYNGFQALGCNYYVINNNLFYNGSIYYFGNQQIFYAYPNDSLIIILQPSGIKVINMNRTPLFSVPVNNPISAEVFKIGDYYYVIVSTLSNLIIYAVKA